MFDPVSILTGQALKFTLVAFRMMGLVMFAPMLGHRAIPANIRVLVGLGLAWVVFPAAPVAVQPLPTHLAGAVVRVAGEFAIGAAVGLLASVVFAGVELGGEVLGQQMGLSLASVFDPTFDDNVPMMS